MVPESEWVWCGYPGHFIGSQYCVLHLHTRVGDYRVSTIGDYRPPHHYDREAGFRIRQDDDPVEDIGHGRKYETFVFRVAGDGEHGEGEVADWVEIDSDGYNEAVDAERGHMAMCRRYAALGVPA